MVQKGYSSFSRTYFFLAVFYFLTLNNFSLFGSSDRWAPIISSINSFLQNTPNGIVNLGAYIPDVIPVIQQNIPAKLRSFFDNVQIESPKLFDEAEGYPMGHTLTGTFSIAGKKIPITVQFVDLEVAIRPRTIKRTINIIYDIQDPFTFSELSSEFAGLDLIPLSKVRFIFTTEAHNDPITGILLVKHFNIFANASLNISALRPLQETLHSIRPGLENETIFFASIVFPSLAQSIFGIRVPVKLGVDYQERYRQHLIKNEPKTITKIELSLLEFIIRPLTLLIAGRAAVTMHLATQEEPLIFRGNVNIQPLKLVIGGNLENRYDPAFGLSWLGFGDMGFQVGIDLKAELVGIPFTNFAFEGGGRIGEGAAKIDVKLAAGFDMTPDAPLPSSTTKGPASQSEATPEEGASVQAAPAGEAASGVTENKKSRFSMVKKLGAPDSLGLKIATETLKDYAPQIGFYAKISQLGFSHMVQLMAQAMGLNKQGNLNLPMIGLTDVEIGILPTGLAVGSSYYNKGILFAGKLNVAGLHGGMRFYADTKSFVGSGFGYLEKIDTSFIKLYRNPGENFTGLPSDGPVVYCELDSDPILGKIPLPRFYLSGVLEIPPLGIKLATDCDITLAGLQAKFDWTVLSVLGLECELIIPLLRAINPANLESLLLRFALRSNAASAIKDKIGSSLHTIAQQLNEKLHEQTVSITTSRDRRIGEIKEKYKNDLVRVEAAIKQKKGELDRAGDALDRAGEECAAKASSFKFWQAEFWEGVGKCLETGGRAFQVTYDWIDNELAELERERLKISLVIDTGIQNIIKELAPALEAIGGVYAKVIDGIGTIVQNIPNMTISRIEGVISGADLKEGKLPKTSVELTVDFFGRRKKLTLISQFDFKHPEKFFSAIAQDITNEVKAEEGVSLVTDEPSIAEPALPTNSSSSSTIPATRERAWFDYAAQ